MATTPTPTGYLALACVTWMFYDYLLTLDDEVELIWMRKWSFTKAIFFSMRWSTLALLLIQVVFFVFLEDIDKSQCDAYSWFNAIATVIVILEVEIVLQIRIYAMYERSRRILWINAILCTLEFLTGGVILTKYYSNAHFVPVPDWIIGACYDVRPKQVGIVWVTPMCFELYLAILAVYKVLYDYRTYGYLGGGILTILVRDSVAHFFLIVIVVAVNCVLWIETEVTPGDSAVNLVHAAGAIGGARLILSMRAAVLRPSLPTLRSLGTTSSIQFQVNAISRP